GLGARSADRSQGLDWQAHTANEGGVVPVPADDRMISSDSNLKEGEMVLLASEFDKSKYLRAEDLKAEKKFRIKAVTVELVGNDRKEEKLVVWFTNDKRGLVLNKTNNRTLRGAFGDDTSAWTNRIIVVFPNDGRHAWEDDSCAAGAHPSTKTD